MFSRVGLMAFESNINGDVKFTRLDTNASVEVNYDPSAIAFAPKVKELMQKSLSGQASGEEVAEFGKLWQQRVENIAINVEQVVTVI